MSTVFSIPGLWLPRPRKVWRPPLLSAMGHLVTKSNHLVVTTGHHLSKQCAGGTPCSNCTGTTPATLTITFASTALATTCADTSAGAAHSSLLVSGSALNGSWTLSQLTSNYTFPSGQVITANPCSWLYTGTDIAASLWNSSSTCAGAANLSSSAFYILLSIGTTLWSVQSRVNFGIENVSLFEGTISASSCTSSVSGMTNTNTTLGTASLHGGKDGTAAWTP